MLREIRQIAKSNVVELQLVENELISCRQDYERQFESLTTQTLKPDVVDMGDRHLRGSR